MFVVDILISGVSESSRLETSPTESNRSRTQNAMPLPLLLDIAAALVAALCALVAVAWASAAGVVPARPALQPARAAGHALRPHVRLRVLLARRLDRSAATGFVLTFALAAALAGGVVLGIFAYLIRALPALRQLDRAVAGWGYDHRSPLSGDGLRTITELGTFQVVVALAVLVTVVDLVHTRNRWSIPFLIVVMAGNELLTTGVKDLVDRARPALVPQAAALGPSFPSGHSATAASFYAAAALILGRRLGPRARRAFGAGAVGVAVAIAGSRVLLDLHWLSDVIGGLALGWGWFALCASVFGGLLHRPTAAVDTATAVATRRCAPYRALGS
jgi:undecaprenyl-diphosphatase